MANFPPLSRAGLRDAACVAARALRAAALRASEAYDLDTATRRAAKRAAVDARALLDGEALWVFPPNAAANAKATLEPGRSLAATSAFGFLFAPPTRTALAATVAGALRARSDFVRVAVARHPGDPDAAPLLPLVLPPALARKVRSALAPPEAALALFLFSSKTGRLLSADGVDGVTRHGAAFLDDHAEKSHLQCVV